MKKLIIAMIVISLAVLPALAGPGCAKAADKKGCTTQQKLACSTPCGTTPQTQCADIEKKLAELKKMKGADSKEMKAVIAILDGMLKCQKDMCAGKCGPGKTDVKAAYSCPKCAGKTFMKPGRCACGANLVKK